MTLAALAVASVARADLVAQWDFENNLTDSAGGITTSVKQGNATYVDSMDAEHKLPNKDDAKYWTSEDMGKAITLGQTNKDDVSTATWLSLGSTIIKDTIVPSKSFTLSAYINFSAFTGNDLISILGSGNLTSAGMAFGIHRENDGYSLSLTTKDKDHNTSGTLTGLTTDTWHHVAVSYTTTTQPGAPDQGYATFYLDGVQVGNTAQVWGYTATSGDVGSAIGSTAQDGIVSYQGTMTLDRVQVFNSALDGADIRKAAGLVPEPTTVTLSLLALAGLAARRRRK